MTDQEEALSEEEVRARVISTQAEGTLVAAQRALDVAVSVFDAMIEEARAGDIATEADIRKAAARLTGLQQAVLKEKAKYDLESGRANGGGGAGSFDFDKVRTEIGSALDRIRSAEAAEGLSG